MNDAGGVGGGDSAEVGLAEDGAAGVGKIDLIEGVEKFGAELEAKALGGIDVLEYGHVPVVKGRAEIVGQKTTDVAEGVGSGVNEGGGMKPAIHSFLGGALGLAGDTGGVRGLAAALGDSGVITGSNGNGCAGLNAGNAVDAPAADEAIHDAGAVEELLAFTEGEIPLEIEGENVGDMVAGEGAIEIAAVVIGVAGILIAEEAGDGGDIVDGLGPSVSGEELQTIGVAFAELGLESVITGVGLGAPLMSNAGEDGIGTEELSGGGGGLAEAGGGGDEAEEGVGDDGVEAITEGEGGIGYLIEVGVRLEFDAGVTGVGDVEEHGPWKFVLHVEVPLGGVWHFVVADVGVDALADEGKQSVGAVFGGGETIGERIAKGGVRRTAAVDAGVERGDGVETEGSGGGGAGPVTSGGGVEKTGTGADDETRGDFVGEADAGGEVIFVDILNAARCAGGAGTGEDESAALGRKAGDFEGEFSIEIEPGCAVEAFGHGEVRIPTEAEVEGEAVVDTPIVLDISGDVGDLERDGGFEAHLATAGEAEEHGGDGVAAAGAIEEAAGEAVIE